MTAEDDIRKAIASIARSPEGAELYLYLQRELMSLPPSAEASALQEHTGHRKFAAKLMALMREGIESGGTSGSGNYTDERRPVSLPRREPVATRRRGSAREWLAANDPELTGKPAEPEPGETPA